MTHEEMLDLRIGDLVTHKSGKTYRVAMESRAYTEEDVRWASGSPRSAEVVLGKRCVPSFHGLRDGKSFGPLRHLKADAITKI